MSHDEPVAAVRSKSGIDTLRFSVSAEYMSRKRWMLGRASAPRSHGDAADSPFTARKSQNTYELFANHRF